MYSSYLSALPCLTEATRESDFGISESITSQISRSDMKISTVLLNKKEKAACDKATD